MYRTLGAALLAAVLLAPAAGGWAGDPDAPHHAELAMLAASALPAHEREVVLAHEDAFRAGANDPDRDVSPFYHRYDVDDPHWGGAPEAAAQAHAQAVAALRAGDHEEAAYRLGYLTHFLLDLSQPMHSGGWDAIANPWHSDYEDAAHAHAEELTLDLSGHEPTPRAPAETAVEIAHVSAARWPELQRALDATPEGAEPWSDEVARITEDALAEALPLVADVLHGAFVEAGFEPAPLAPDDVGAPEVERASRAPSDDAAAEPPLDGPREVAEAREAPSAPVADAPVAPALAVVGIGVVAALGAAIVAASRRAPQGRRAGAAKDKP